MDNLCHSLVGMALSRAGLHKRTALATSTLVIANNLPDIDVGVFATDTLAMSFRRGWTHGVLAQLTLPIVLTGAMLVYDRYRRRSASGQRAVPSQILLLSYIGVLLHVFMDFTNSYGVRLLDAVLRSVVLRRRSLHRRSVAVSDARAWLVARQAERASGAESEWRWPRSTWWRCWPRTSWRGVKWQAAWLAPGVRPTRASW